MFRESALSFLGENQVAVFNDLKDTAIGLY